MVTPIAAAALLGAAAACTTVQSGASRSGASFCRPLGLSAGYVSRVRQATEAGQDLWGNALLRATGGPSYEAAHRFLKPLLLADQPPKARPLTDSGAYYLAFGRPRGVDGGGPIALHLADGSEIVSDRAAGPKLALDVGADGRERFGSCLARLSTPRLYGGYYPILDTEYVDGNGTQFRQESFVARLPQTGSLASFVRLDVDVPKGAAAEKISFTPSGGGDVTGSSLEYDVGASRTILVARPIRPAPSKPLTSTTAPTHRPGARSRPTGTVASRAVPRSSCRSSACSTPSATS